MTVKEYLGCLNNCVLADDMDVSEIRTIGFIDIIDDYEEMSAGHSAFAYSVSNGNLTVKTTIFGKELSDDFDVCKVISLDDKLANHCGDKDEKEVIERTISGIKEKLEDCMSLEKYKPGNSKRWQVALDNFECYGRGKNSL